MRQRLGNFHCATMVSAMTSNFFLLAKPYQAISTPV
ncbi:MAG: hypothetical protein K0S11_799 [Gammaproteobacteria bacterium]|jgi:hypothetical protein|nr:hypothetical protein [Gammaproteobacteria bacterium]